MKQILISGYYGFDNAGDEAVLAGLVTGLRQHARTIDLDITALSINPARTQELHQINAKHRYKELLPALMKTDLLLSGGGSLLQDVTSAHGIFYYLAVVRMAQILGCKTMFIAQGIGPLTRKRSIKLTASVANRLDAITVRDPASCALLESIGVTRTINITADPALLLRPNTSSKRDDILVSLREWPDTSANFYSNLAKAIIQIGVVRQVKALVMHGDSDAAEAGNLLRLLHLPPVDLADAGRHPNFREVFDQIAGSEMVLAMRLHALIFSAAAGIPAVALSYDPKVTAFMHQIGQDAAVIDVKSSDADQIADAIRGVWQTRREHGAELLKRLPHIRQLAQKNADIAYHLLL